MNGETSSSLRETVAVRWVTTGLVVLLFTHSILLLAYGNGHDRDIGWYIVGVIASGAAAAGFLMLHSRLIALDGDELRGPLPFVVLFAAVGATAVALAWMTLPVVVPIILLGYRGRRRARMVVLFVILNAGLVLRDIASPIGTIFALTFAFVVGLLMTMLLRQETLLLELRLTREHLARVEVDAERQRISRDLHDILGRTLTAVSLRTQTALRAVDMDVDLTRAQLEETARALDDAQSQLRGLVRGTAVLGTAEEVDAALELLRRLGIRCEVAVDPPADPVLDDLVARIIRESVTNLLKHSRPHVVGIGVRTESGMVVVTVVNDGAPPPTSSRGTGLDDLRLRLAPVGGTLEAGEEARSLFRVVAHVPLRGRRSAPVAARSDAQPAGSARGVEPLSAT